MKGNQEVNNFHILSYFAKRICNNIVERVHPIFYTTLWNLNSGKNTIDCRVEGRKNENKRIQSFCAEIKRKLLPSFLLLFKKPTSRSRIDWLYMCTTERQLQMILAESAMKFLSTMPSFQCKTGSKEIPLFDTVVGHGNHDRDEIAALVRFIQSKSNWFLIDKTQSLCLHFLPRNRRKG